MATPVLDNLDFGKVAQILNALFHGVTADPATPGTGQFWFRTDTKQLSFYDGTAIQRVLLVGQSTTPNGAAGGDLAGTYPNPTLTSTANVLAIIRAVTLDTMAAPAADVSLNNHKITTLADPVNPQDVVNLRTLLNNMAGLDSRAEVAYATAAALPANTYANGASGVGATLTATANAALTVDGQAVQVGDRILVQNEAAAANNGIYTVTQVGDGTHPYILTRATDFNASTNIGPGVLIGVEAPANRTAGTANNGKVFISISNQNPVVGTAAITFSGVGNVYTAGAGLTLTGNQFTLTSPVAVANGGTGATTAAAARTNLAATTKYAANLGDGVATAYTVNHALGTTDVQVQVWELTGSKRLVVVDTAIVDANNVTVTFAVAPAANAYRVVVIG